MPGSRRDVARTFIAVCLRQGAPRPDFSTAEAFRRMLENAGAIALSDPAVGGSAGVHLAKMFEREGLAATVKAKGLPQQSGVEVARRVVEGKADVGLTLSGEVASVEGAVIAGPVPPPFGQDTLYGAAVMAGERGETGGLRFHHGADQAGDAGDLDEGGVRRSGLGCKRHLSRPHGEERPQGASRTMEAAPSPGSSAGSSRRIASRCSS